MTESEKQNSTRKSLFSIVIPAVVLVCVLTGCPKKKVLNTTKKIVKTAKIIKTETKPISSDYLKKLKSVNVSDKVDPANPPEYLRIRVADSDGKPLTLFLIKHSVRRKNYIVELRQPGGKMDNINPGPVRTYRGWCEELPDSMVGAYLMPDGQVAATLLRAIWTKGDGSKDGSGPGAFTAGKPQGSSITDQTILKLAKTGEKGHPATPFKFISGSPKFVSGKPYSGASFVKPNPEKAPFFEKCTVIDQTFRTRAKFFKDRPMDDNPAGYQRILMDFEYASLVYDLIALRDGNEAFRISNVLFLRPDDKLINDRNLVNKLGLPEKPSDVLCNVASGGGGGAGSLMELNSNKSYMSAIRYDSHVMAHELGHFLNWGGDYQGAGVEGGLLGGGGNRYRYGTPAARKRNRTRKALMKNEVYRSAIEYISRPEFPLPPYAACDQLKANMNDTLIVDFLANDFTSNEAEIALADFETTSREGGRVEFIAKGGPDGRDAFKYTAPDGYLGEDRFSYSIVNSNGRIGYGNVIVSLGLPRRLLAYVPLDDVDEFNEYDLLKNYVDSDLTARLGVNWHKHRTQPFLAFWDLGRDLGRGGYFDMMSDPVYDLNTNGKYKGKPNNGGNWKNPPKVYGGKIEKVWDHKDFTLDISGQPFLNSADGTYDLMFQRWGYVYPAKYVKLEGNTPKVTLNKIELLVDGKVVASRKIDARLKLKKETPNRSERNSRWIQMATGRYSYRLKIEDLKTPEVQKALKVAAAAKEYIKRVRLETTIPLEKVAPVPGPKVELRVTLSKTEGDFVGGLMMTPVDQALENVKGKFGNCLKLHGFEQLNYEMLPDGNNYRTLSVWAWVPEWNLWQQPYLMKVGGRNGIAPRETDKGIQMGYNDVHVTADDWQYFAMPPTKEWFHLALVIGKDAKVFINGKQVAQSERIKNKVPNFGFLGFNLTAALDDLRVYGGALTQADIVEIMDGGKTEFIKPVNGIGNYSGNQLTWAPSAVADKQQLFIGTEKSALDSMKPVVTLNGRAGSYKASLTPDTTYFWRIDTVRKDGSVNKGTVWTFSTGKM